MTQERRRYGFVLERQCSLSKHYLSYYSHGVDAYQENIEKWSDVAKTREYLPEAVENIFSNRLRQISVWQDEDLYSNPRSPNFEDDRMSINSQLRKTKSMDASCLDIRSIGDADSPVNTLNRAKSEYNLNSSQHSVIHDGHTPTRRPKSMAVPPPPAWDTQLARALYAYLSSGENQLSFLEGDLIALIGDRNKGWQFGENLRTQCSGWFPLAYTEFLDDPTLSPTHRSDAGGSSQHSNNPTTPTSGKMMSSTGSATPTGNNTLEQPVTRMFGDTLHLHRSSNNAKQIRRAIGSNNIPPPALPAPVPTPSLPHSKTGLTQSHSTSFSSKNNMDTSTFQSPYSTTGIKSSASTYNFSAPPSGAYSTHPAPSRSDRPTAVAPLPLHLQTKGGKIGGPVGNVSLHSSNDSGFSNEPPPQPEIDYSDDDSIPGHTKLPSRRRILKQLDEENNNKTLPNPKKSNSIKQSRSHGNLVNNRSNISENTDLASKENKKLVKRTKSFWKFGKSGADNDILEGMSLWRHRDLVDVDNNKSKRKIIKTAKIQERPTRRSRDKSNDSDRTINNNNKENGIAEKQTENTKVRRDDRNNKSFIDKQKATPETKKLSTEKIIDFEDTYKTPVKPDKFDDQFYDDDGDGLMLKTVNRKNILQQYTNNSSGTESDSDSDVTSDDPYDCILVDDQKVKKTENNFPNVAELGKKLEKLSKTSKYSPNKDSGSPNKNIVNEKNERNARLERSSSERKGSPDGEEIIQFHDKRQLNKFQSFGIEIQNNENGEKERLDSDRYYVENQIKRSESNAQEKRRHFADSAKNSKERRPRPSYESIDSDVEQRNIDNRNSRRSGHGEADKRDKMKYYDSTNDELSDGAENRQLLPRTKLTKSNSNNSSHSKYERDAGLMDYGETLQRRLKNPEYNSKFDEKSPHNGNMYGPWYDLWGLDSTGTARRK
nr:uncharacterized protein DDB_G0284459-like [Leptinotarsa decemlineata]